MKAVTLALPIIFSMFLLSNSVISLVDNSVILYLTFNSDEGKTVKDISLHHNDGTIKGNPKKVKDMKTFGGFSVSALEKLSICWGALKNNK